MKKVLYLIIFSLILSFGTLHNLYPKNLLNKKLINFDIIELSRNDTDLYLSQERYWIKEDTGWHLNTITDYKYDLNGNIVEEIADFFSLNWNIPTKITKRLYDSDNRLINIVVLQENSGQVDSISKTIFFYENLLFQKLILQRLNNTLRESRRTNYFYDLEQRLVEEVYQDKGIYEWINSNKYTYSYNNLNLKAEASFYQWASGAWVFAQKDSFFYDSQNRLEIQILYIGSGTAVLKHQTQYLDNSKEINRFKYLDTTNTWSNDRRWIYYYNIDSLLIEKVYFDDLYNLNEATLKWEYSYAPLYQLTNVKLEGIVKQFNLFQNYPNPFNPSTKISWQTSVSSWQTLKVYDVLGNEIANLVDEYRNAGSYEVEFNSIVSGRQLANGIYFYRLQAGDYVETKKMILLK